MKITIPSSKSNASFVMMGRQFCITTRTDYGVVYNLWKVQPLIHKMQIFVWKSFKATHLILTELVTTLTELSAIAAPANIGLRNPSAANGMPMVLYTKAQNRF